MDLVAGHSGGAGCREPDTCRSHPAVQGSVPAASSAADKPEHQHADGCQHAEIHTSSPTAPCGRQCTQIVTQ